MGLKAYTDGYDQEVGVVNMHGSWEGNSGGELVYLAFKWDYCGIIGPCGFGRQTSSDHSTDSSGSYTRSPSVTPDAKIKFRAKVYNQDASDISEGQSSGQFKTYAPEPSADNPAVTLVTASTAHVECTFDAGDLIESHFHVRIEYKRPSETNWTQAGATKNSGTDISRDLSDLQGGTTYQVRLRGDRDTENTTEWTSGTVVFTTISTAPAVFTSPATVVAFTKATLNGLVDPNSISSRVFFGWGTSDAGGVKASWQNLTTVEAVSGDGSRAFEANIIGLSPNTVYFFRAFVEWPSALFDHVASDVTLSFTTPLGPGVGSALENLMHLPQYDANYGVAYDVFFCLSSPSATSSDRLVTTAPGSLFATGDVKLSKDGAALANYTVANIVQVGASNPLYKMPLVAADVEAELIVIQIRDQDGPAFRDLYILVRTKQRLGQLIVDASHIGSNASAIMAIPSTGGRGIDVLDSTGGAVGNIGGFLDHASLLRGTLTGGGASSATLSADAIATNDYYNGDVLMLVSGTGAGQSRIISDYANTRVATVNSPWATNPVSGTKYVIVPGDRTWDVLLPELGAIPAADGAAGLKLQFCYQRFAFMIDQTATQQTLYNAAGGSLGTRTVDDDGTTQTIDKVI